MKLLLLVEVVKLMYSDSNDFGSTSFDQEIPILATLLSRGCELLEFGECESLAQLSKEAPNEPPPMIVTFSLHKYSYTSA